MLLAGCFAFFHVAESQIMSIDLGHEFFKVALMRQGVPLEIVLNTHSKRKTTTAVSFFDAVRTFGDDALSHQGKDPAKVPMFFHSSLGKNYTAADIDDGGKWWSDFGLGDKFYSYQLGYNATRGVPTFKIGDDEVELEEVLASVFFFAKKIADDSGEGKVINVRDLVVTMPSDAMLRQRQAIAAASEIAGLRLLTLVHETSAFAVQRAVDFSVESGSIEYALYYNMGARKTEVTVVRLEARSAGMVKGKTAPVVSVVGSALDYRLGGHLMDLKIAEVMLKRFQDKYPKLADAVVKDPRALRKLLAQAQKSKAMLSSNKMAPFIVESLHADTDFQATIKREEFEEMCSDMFEILTEPIEKALASANITIADIAHVEVIGGAWRVPKVQQLLSDYIEKGKGEKVHLGQHLNGEEGGALGAALVAANSSSSFRVKKIFFSDNTQHEYAVQISALSGEWEKNVTVLYPAGTALGSKKKLNFDSSEDFAVKLFENGILLTEYTVTGLKELLEGKWKDYNLTGAPKVSATVPLDGSGLIEFKNPTATVEESYWVNFTKEKPKKNATNATNATKDENSTADSKVDEKADEKADEKDEDTADEKADEKAEGDEANAEEKVEGEGEDKAEGEGDEKKVENSTNASAAEEEEEPEIGYKLKKKKHEKKLKVVKKEFFPMPLCEDRIAELKKKLQTVADREHEVQAAAGVKNELEAAIYGARDKLDRDDIVQVSTEALREEITKLATYLEDWMFEPGHSKADYETQLAALSNLISPMEERVQEMEARSGLKESVDEQVQDMKKTGAIIEKNMTWVNASKIEAVLKKVVDFEEWWAKKLESQASLPLHEAPAFTAKEVREKVGKLVKDMDKLKKTKKPKEPEAKKPKKDKDGKDDAKASDKKPEEPLPADLPAAEAELAELRKKKADAVEKEDFDMAHSLKTREAALVKHLEKLRSEQGEQAEEKEKTEL